MFSKEPTEELDFGIGWTDWLGDLTIQSSSWSGPTGIVIVADTFSATSTVITLGGGTWAEIYELENTITASNGESETRSILVRIQRSVAYCSSTEVRRRMAGGSGSGGSATTVALNPAELDALIEQASRMFDLECGVPERYFNPVEVPIAQTRTFYGDSSHYLQLPPYVAGSLDTVLTLPSGYIVPDFIEQNGYLVITDSNGLAPPFHHPVYSLAGWWTGVPITVSAIWGWRETPADVRMAVIELVINLHRETDPATLKLTGLDGQALREKMPPRVLEVAKRYRPKIGPAFV
jgi:hypothetical protein